MPSTATIWKRRFKAIQRNIRGAEMIVKGLSSTDHPLLAHIIPIRRCNLACEYCNEFDDVSKPVPTDTMFQRVDKLGALGTSVITISGGEPLLHPELDDIIRRIRKNGMVAGLITNGYLLVAERIQRLNKAGLEWLQISIDNVTPDDVSKKSLKVLDRKLELLAEHRAAKLAGPPRRTRAEFRVPPTDLLQEPPGRTAYDSQELKETAERYRKEARRVFLQIENYSLVMAEVRKTCAEMREKIAAPDQLETKPKRSELQAAQEG